DATNHYDSFRGYCCWPGLRLSTLRPRPPVCRVFDPASALRALRARLQLCRCRRRPSRLHHVPRGRNRGWGCPEHRSPGRSAVLGARGIMAAADRRRHAWSAAPDERADDRVAISSQSGREPVWRRTVTVGNAPRKRSWLGLFVPALLAFAVLIALGTWQLQRKTWKEALIASLTERLAAPPQALPAAADWGKLDRARDEYRRVKFTATLDDEREALVFAAASAFRPDAIGPGYWVFTPARG